MNKIKLYLLVTSIFALGSAINVNASDDDTQATDPTATDSSVTDPTDPLADYKQTAKDLDDAKAVLAEKDKMHKDSAIKALKAMQDKEVKLQKELADLKKDEAEAKKAASGAGNKNAQVPANKTPTNNGMNTQKNNQTHMNKNMNQPPRRAQ